MRLIHSYSTRPLGVNIYGIAPWKRLITHVWFSALSVAYAHASGATIALHTDTLGARLLTDVPYDEVIVDLDEMGDLGIRPQFWAAAKFVALRNEPLGSVHIDGDVFIKRPELLERIASCKAAAIVQHYENARWYVTEDGLYNLDTEYYRKATNHEIAERGAYNTGIVGIFDAQLKDEFVEGYFDLARHYSDVGAKVFDRDGCHTPDLVLEQQRLWHLCQGRDVDCLLGSEDYGENKDLICSRAAAIGYQHVFTSKKYDELHLCRRILKRMAPDVYSKIDKLFKTIKIYG